MAQFVESSQASSWLFLADNLRKHREAIGNSQNITLSLPEQALLLRHFEQCILRVTAALRFDEALQASAVTFFKRYYVHNAFNAGAPFDIASAALALAIKTEACPYNEVPQFLAAAAKLLRTDTGGLMQHEMAFIAGIKFHLTLHHPYKALRGILAHFKQQFNVQLTSKPGAELAPAPQAQGAEAAQGGGAAAPSPPSLSVPIDEWRALANRARLFAMHSLTTDCALLFTPAQIALACLQLAAGEHATLHTPLNAPPPPSLASHVLQFTQSLIAEAGQAADKTAAHVPVTPTPAAVPAAAAAILSAASAPDISAQAFPLLSRVAPQAEEQMRLGSKAFEAGLQMPPPAPGSGPPAPPSTLSGTAAGRPAAASAAGPAVSEEAGQGASKKKRIS